MRAQSMNWESSLSLALALSLSLSTHHDDHLRRNHSTRNSTSRPGLAGFDVGGGILLCLRAYEAAGAPDEAHNHPDPNDHGGKSEPEGNGSRGHLAMELRRRQGGMSWNERKRCQAARWDNSP